MPFTLEEDWESWEHETHAFPFPIFALSASWLCYSLAGQTADESIAQIKCLCFPVFMGLK